MLSCISWGCPGDMAAVLESPGSPRSLEVSKLILSLSTLLDGASCKHITLRRDTAATKGDNCLMVPQPRRRRLLDGAESMA
ncbi:hypothetical protein L1887_05600 [Cichorium endivia]|nr:hypothetical protein L1887_05600 [Cichorium endivia]